jgi:hypothetical protein
MKNINLSDREIALIIGGLEREMNYWRKQSEKSDKQNQTEFSKQQYDLFLENFDVWLKFRDLQKQLIKEQA